MTRRMAYIPARGGSKGIPKKNIVDFGGEPMIARTIAAARQSGLFDMVFVSTDAEEIADVARRYGADVPFLRYAEFAQDTSRTIDAVCSDKARFEEMGLTFDVFCLLQATSPFRRAEDIAGAMKLYEEHADDKGCRGVVSVNLVEEHPILMRTRGEDGKLTNVLSCSSTVRRQDMPPYYRVNGAIYVNAWEDLSPELSLNDNPYGYVMAKDRSLDVDTRADLENGRKIVSGGAA